MVDDAHDMNSPLRGQDAEKVAAIFSSVAPHYDRMNDLMSGGLHRYWKHRLVDALYVRGRARHVAVHIDAAGGTGDIAHLVARAVPADAAFESHVIDRNAGMLAVGAARTDDRRIHFTRGDAEALPVASACADFYTIAFGIRNVADRQKALGEAYRVLRSGGRFVCLEFSQPTATLARRLYDAYSFAVIPRLGARIAGDADAYRYLVESIRQFPAPETFAGMVEAAGFARVRVVRLSGGIATLHTGWRL